MNIQKIRHYIKIIITLIAIIPWSIIIILLLQIKSLLSEQLKISNKIEVLDSVSIKQPEFFNLSAKEGLQDALFYYNIKHSDIVYAQAKLETGNFTSKICLDNNNLFGLYDSNNKQYYRYKHWTESVLAYKNYIQSKYKPPEDYYNFLERIKYAEDKSYTRLLKEIIE